MPDPLSLLVGNGEQGRPYPMTDAESKIDVANWMEWVKKDEKYD